jgi:hypothetical protein
MALVWLESGGGPFAVVARASLPHWSGTAADYDRACEVADPVGVLTLSDGSQALVLGDEPLATAYLPDCLALVRWGYAESEDGVADLIRAGLAAAVWEEGPVLSTTGELVMFDAAYPGTGVGVLTDGTALALPAGTYRIDSARIEPDSRTSFSVHRFVHPA